MRIFVTGASGFIGRATVPDLVAAGHAVTGLVRTDESAAILEAAGGKAVRGTLDDLDVLASAAAESDAVIHLAFKHDLLYSGDMAAAAAADRAAIETLASAIGGDDPAIAIASGLVGLDFGRPATEDDIPESGGHAGARVANAELTLGLADRGIRSAVVRLAPTVHGEGDQGFVQTYAQIARRRGVVGYLGDGSNRWPAVHRTDAGSLFRRVVESAPAGSVLHGVAEEGIAIRDLAEALGRSMGLPTASIDPSDAGEHFSWLGGFVAMNAPASSTRTRELLDWDPTGPTLLDDVAAGHYGA